MNFFIIRLVVFFGAWILFRRAIVGHSLKQDVDGDEKHTIRNAALSVRNHIWYSHFHIRSLGRTR